MFFRIFVYWWWQANDSSHYHEFDYYIMEKVGTLCLSFLFDIFVWVLTESLNYICLMRTDWYSSHAGWKWFIYLLLFCFFYSVKWLFVVCFGFLRGEWCLSRIDCLSLWCSVTSLSHVRGGLSARTLVKPRHTLHVPLQRM